ncbi:hypothetical protein [Streptomyces kanamyceticus]|uniref:Secreted protein n=1 Tax=Streptomyces kanamyceticus TaxID=1967 RepID=A0A5J6G7Y1_STRKN|nr:hypothetical protein [Streptomyces kanamyceticus]QEU89871.1 hypothetical protein CP970_02025 [Streptomyces kanamyceticus]
MRTIHTAGLGAVAALAGLAGVLAPTAHAGTAPTPQSKPTMLVAGTADTGYSTAGYCQKRILRWGYEGYRACGSNRVIDVSWDGNNTPDETFVIGPNNHIYHVWKRAGGWKEMPGNGRANTIRDACMGPGYRGIMVWAGNTTYSNGFYSGKWHGWEKGTC